MSTCLTCKLHTGSDECRAHAPLPNHEEKHLRVFWPKTTDEQGCGLHTAEDEWLQCCRCSFWWVPTGGINPGYRQGLSPEWWALAGFCIRNAPSPNSRESLPTFWPITHATADGCGAGEPYEEEEAPI